MAYNGKEGDMISKEDARLLMTNYRNSPAYPANNLIEGILFGKDPIIDLLSQNGCKGIRIYYGKAGISNADAPQMIIVGTDVDGNDMTAEYILDAGVPCPSFCSSVVTKL